ncbi:hypothetical protein CBD41_01685 [bacterium TMED181]|nr:hypothetical protein [Planctomycetota bacterium]OUW47094.1 MAG: hypothetical protein CBD41_01685 [bacterium TMED181]
MRDFHGPKYIFPIGDPYSLHKPDSIPLMQWLQQGCFLFSESKLRMQGGDLGQSWLMSRSTCPHHIPQIRVIQSQFLNSCSRSPMSNIPNGWFTVLNSLELSDPEHSGSHALITPAAGWELRLDLWQGDWPREVSEDWGQVLITDRGGALKPDSAARTQHRNQLCLRKKTWLDVDLSSDAPAPEGIPWILSRHLEQDQPDALHKLTSEAQDLGAVAVKLVLPSETPLSRRLELLQQAKNSDFPCVTFSMASQNHADRLWAMESGQPWAYLGQSGLQQELPGMLLATELRQRYQWSTTEPPQDRFLILGDAVRHSLSPDWHNRIFAKHGISARFYPWSTQQPDLDLAAWKTQGPGDLKGLAITTPYKSWAKSQGSEVTWASDSTAETQPSWNTLMQQGDRWTGTSTDGVGAWNLIAEVIKDSRSFHRPLVILGRGGAAQSVAKAFMSHGWETWLACRPGTLNRSDTDFKDFHITDDPECVQSADVLINATGTDDQRSADWPWNLEDFNGTVALEMDYSSGHTSFEKALTSREGITTFSGFDFFASQARLQAQLFYGLDISLKESLELVQQICQERNSGQYPTS